MPDEPLQTVAAMGADSQEPWPPSSSGGSLGRSLGGSPAPSTVDLHGPASLGQASSVPSLLSQGGALELSDSQSTPSLTVSSCSASSGRERSEPPARQAAATPAA